eukprot:947194-Pyramimonas_sp.AAC.1
MECIMDQSHYVSQLKAIPMEKFKDMKDEDKANDELVSLYMSLLGGVAWKVLTRADIVVLVGKLQRCMKNVT